MVEITFFCLELRELLLCIEFIMMTVCLNTSTGGQAGVPTSNTNLSSGERCFRMRLLHFGVFLLLLPLKDAGSPAAVCRLCRRLRPGVRMTAVLAGGGMFSAFPSSMSFNDITGAVVDNSSTLLSVPVADSTATSAVSQAPFSGINFGTEFFSANYIVMT